MTERTKYLDRAKTGQIYFRVNGKKTRLPDNEASPEFAEAYDRLLAAHRGGCLPAARHRKRRVPVVIEVGTISWFIDRYLASKYFVGRDGGEPELAVNTRSNYRHILKIVRETLGSAKLADLTPENVDRYLAKIAREHAPTTPAFVKVALSNLWKFARGFDEFDRKGRTNPLADVGSLYTVQHEHEPWPQDVQDRFLAACDEQVYFAFHLLLCTGQRISDVVAMKWSDFDGTHFKIRQKKTWKKTHTEMRIKAPKVLLDLLERRQRVSDYVLTNTLGKPYSTGYLALRIRMTLFKIGAYERGQEGRRGRRATPNYSAHGLRKNAGVMLAENGATVPQIMAALGHTTPKLALYYCRLANQKTLNDQAVAIMDDVFDRRAAVRKMATRAKLKVVE